MEILEQQRETEEDKVANIYRALTLWQAPYLCFTGTALYCPVEHPCEYDEARPGEFRSLALVTS